MFHPRPTVVEVCGLWRRGRPRHCRRSIGFVTRHELHASTFLRPFAPRALPRFVATTDALTPGGRLFGNCWTLASFVAELRLARRGSLFLASTLPTLLSPTTPPPQPRHLRSFTLEVCSWPHASGPCTRRRQREGFPQGSWRGLRTALAGSPVGMAESGLRCVLFDRSRRYGRVVHLRQLSTPCGHDAVAFGYRPVNVRPDGDLHPAVCTPPQAHERRTPVRLVGRFHDARIAHSDHEPGSANLCPTWDKDLHGVNAGSWGASTSNDWTRIGAMNLIGSRSSAFGAA